MRGSSTGSKGFLVLVFTLLILALLLFWPSTATGDQILINPVPGVTNQHPTARGEATYDTNPATGLYQRNLDNDVNYPAVSGLPYDNLAGYPKIITGDFYCTPTAALSLVKWWDNDPRYPNLFTAADTDRSVILEIAGYMDTDDLANLGGNDPNEIHLGTRVGDQLPGLLAYFNAHYPNQFRGWDVWKPGDPGTLGNLVKTLVSDRNVPFILGFPGHSTVGVGYDTDFQPRNRNYYLVKDPWTGVDQVVSGHNVGMGRPRLAEGVFGGDFYDTLEYDPTLPGDPEDSRFLPVDVAWVEPVPEPSTLILLGSAVLLACLRRRK